MFDVYYLRKSAERVWRLATKSRKFVTMSSLIRRYEANNIATTFKIMRLSLSTAANQSRNNEDTKDSEFRVLQLIPTERRRQGGKYIKPKATLAPSKAETMTPETDWQAVWPAARTFHPDVVPLPLRQGYKNPKGEHPGKHANPELMKIPNFLHLTPPVIKRHCEAIKKFCTKWPKELKTEEACERHFPTQIITSDYCYSSPTIRDPLARIVSLKVKLSSLNLDAHAKDKMLRLVGDRYNPQTDTITITADRCPTRTQNLDYVKYLLTALYHVSWRVEPWENEKLEEDMEYYVWEKNKSKESLMARHSWPEAPSDSGYESIPHANQYRDAVSDLINKGEDLSSLDQYKQAVKNMLYLKSCGNTQ